ncbi:hypothetical protein FEM48_Zijuj03G0192300 [Ziziphus jujuba var. spinosa]|uniref:PGG domain-containing protein n=1 Tax=Ziziphus jujuba var. spinosa TaxID=714518 RepID=A0A978VS45_ZIZJJ|nr:hypothetical protein FEM48_Zijuj03G0192300 [Ziziphus jujuba var. spinosa]
MLNVVQYILKSPFLKNIINVADKEGNTPLHLAVGGDKYSIIKILADDIRVFKKAQNLNFQKPVDLIQTNSNLGELQEVGREHQDKEMKSYRLKNISSIHLLVASLIATVTFTADFRMPGGYEGQDPLKKGMALLSNQTSFQLFVTAASVAFYCSSASVFLQICGAIKHNYYLLLHFTRVAATLC